MPSELEGAIESLIKVFHCYADKDGDSNTLNKKELKLLMETELSSFLKFQKDPAAVEHIMEDLDQNRDSLVDFNEFVFLVVSLSIACESLFQIHKSELAKK